MDTNKGHTNQYTAEDIVRYLQGKMSPAEMHAIEKAALEDPMLSDAIEGMQLSISRYGVRESLAPLEKLNQKERSRKVVPVRNMKWWTVAAAASVLIVAGVLTFNYFIENNATQEKLSKVEETNEPADSSATVAATTERSSSVPVNADSANFLQPKKQNEDLALNKQPKAANQKNKSESIPLDKERESEKEASEKITLSESIDAETDITKKDRTDSSAAATVSETVSGQLQGRVAGVVVNNNAAQKISGRVLNSSMEPLAYASLQPSNSNRSLNTDKNGNFIVTSPDSVLTVKVNAAGYQEQQFRLSNSRELNEIVLKPSSQKPEEVVVAGYGTKSARRKNADVIEEEVSEPVTGWAKFNEYIEKNKVYPAERNYSSGEVTLSFNVNRQGKPTDIKIENSLAKPYDEEAVRLIIQGPKWKFIRGNREKVIVTIKF